MLRSWLQRPTIGDLLSDTIVIKMAEKMVESEKTLATLLQSANVRLPGCVSEQARVRKGS